MANEVASVHLGQPTPFPGWDRESPPRVIIIADGMEEWHVTKARRQVGNGPMREYVLIKVLKFNNINKQWFVVRSLVIKVEVLTDLIGHLIDMGLVDLDELPGSGQTS